MDGIELSHLNEEVLSQYPISSEDIRTILCAIEDYKGKEWQESQRSLVG